MQYFDDALYDEPILVKKLQQDLSHTGISKRYSHVTFEYMEKRGVPTEIQRQFKACKDYAKNILEHHKKGVGLFLKGGVGTMKTSLLVAIMREAMKKGLTVFFLPMASLVDMLLNATPEERQQLEEKLRSVDVLCLDDFGSEANKDWMIAKVNAILTERYNRMLPILISTNMPSEEIKGRYDPRSLDRLRECCRGLTFDCKSLRKTITK